MERLKEIIKMLGGLNDPFIIDKLSGRVGYVYPDGQKAFYVHSNIEGMLVEISCKKGFFYAEIKEAD